MTGPGATPDFFPEPYNAEQPDFLQRWEDGEFVRLTATTRRLHSGFFGDWGSDVPENQKNQEAPHEGPIGPARCRPMGYRVFHSDMGWPCEWWQILDPMPNIGARPGDLLFHCLWADKGRNGTGLDAWPTDLAIMYEDESTYVAFITMKQWKEFYFPTAEEDFRQNVIGEAALLELIHSVGGRMPEEASS